MRVLLIKTSSMGDLIHTLPALSDAGKALPKISFDWVVEESFAEIPAWHPLVDRVIPIALRRWRKNIFSQDTRAAWQQWRDALQGQSYDVILDAQGLAKSAFLTFFAQGVRAGLDGASAREWLAALAYQRKYQVNFYQHAVVRMRSLFSQALGYSIRTTMPDFGIDLQLLPPYTKTEKYIVFLHGTTWASKQWPETYWAQLATIVKQAGYRIKIGGGNPTEVARAERIAQHCDAVDVVAYLSISQMATLLAHAEGAVAVDTGFGHLAGALSVPTVSLYGSTNPDYTGALGNHSVHLKAAFPCAPCLNRECTYKKSASVSPACYGTLTPNSVWQALQQAM